MNDGSRLGGADPHLVEGWLRARSVARCLAQPIHAHGGLRLDTASGAEARRYVFAAPCEGLRRLAGQIYSPGIFLKVFVPDDALAAVLPPRWRHGSARFLMVRPAPAIAPAPMLPAGYRLVRSTSAEVLHLRIVTGAGEVAAMGSAAIHNGFFVYDRIETHPNHRRKGLARAVMHALDRFNLAEARPVLVATAEGRRLYDRLGWTAISPYSTAFIPEPRH